MTELPLQPPAETPPPVLMRPAIQAAWRAELASSMASLHPPVDDMAPTEPTRPLRNAPRGTEPTPLLARAVVALPPPIPVAAPEPEPVVDLRPRAARTAFALTALAVASVAVGLAIAFFFAKDVDVRVDVEAPPAVAPAADEPAPVVTPLPEVAPAPAPQPAIAPEPAADPEPAAEQAKPKSRDKSKSRAKRERRPEPEPEREFVERIVEDPGFFTVDASPYATVYIDGRKIGDTPVIRHSLSAGKHDVKLVSSEGGTKRFSVTIEPGKTLRRRVGAME